MIKVLVFGANGLIGSVLKNRVNLYNNIDLITPSRADIDVSDLKAVMSYFVENNDKFDMVINLASITDIGLCESSRKLSFSNNAESSKFVSFWANYYKKPLIYLSTLENIWEENNYLLSKLKAEEEVLKFYKNRVIKTYNVYSSLESDHKPISRAIRDIFNNKVDFNLSHKKVVTSSANSVCDKLLQICILLSEQKTFSPSLIINFVDANMCSEIEVYNFIAEKLNKKINIKIKEEKDNFDLKENIKSDILHLKPLFHFGKSWKENLSEVIDEVVEKEKNKFQNSAYSIPIFNFQNNYNEEFDI